MKRSHWITWCIYIYYTHGYYLVFFISRLRGGSPFTTMKDIHCTWKCQQLKSLKSYQDPRSKDFFSFELSFFRGEVFKSVKLLRCISYLLFGRYHSLFTLPQSVIVAFVRGIMNIINYHFPGDTSRDLFIPDRWRSPTTIEKAHKSPSQKRSPAELSGIYLHVP